MNLFKSKRGQFQNYMAVVVFIFGFIFLSLIGYALYDGFISEFTGAGYGTDDASQKAIKGFNRGMNLFDGIIVLIMVVFLIAIALTSYKLASPPIFFIITFIMAIFLGIASYFFNILFAEIIGTGVFNTVTNHFPISLIIAQNFHWIALVALIIGSITLYAKKDKGQYV